MSDASEADRQEQEREVKVPETEPEPLPDDPEVPEADAVEQTLPAPVDDEERR